MERKSHSREALRLLRKAWSFFWVKDVGSFLNRIGLEHPMTCLKHLGVDVSLILYKVDILLTLYLN